MQMWMKIHIQIKVYITPNLAEQSLSEFFRVRFSTFKDNLQFLICWHISRLNCVRFWKSKWSTEDWDGVGFRPHIGIPYSTAPADFCLTKYIRERGSNLAQILGRNIQSLLQSKFPSKVCFASHNKGFSRSFYFTGTVGAFNVIRCQASVTPFAKSFDWDI